MRHSEWCLNFILRFFYEFFLEFSICAFLQLSVKDFSEFSPTLQFYLSVAVTAAIIALVVFVISLFFWNGPWIPNYFTKGTSISSFMRKRPVNPFFNTDKYLIEHPVPERGPWGRIIINFEF